MTVAPTSVCLVNFFKVLKFLSKLASVPVRKHNSGISIRSSLPAILCLDDLTNNKEHISICRRLS